MKKKIKLSGKSIFFAIIIIYVIGLLINSSLSDKIISDKNKTLHILSSYDNVYVEKSLKSYAEKEKINIKMTYKGDLDIVEELNNNSNSYDAVWISNSMWLYMLNNSYLTSNSKSISISPVVFGIKKSTAKKLNLINNKNITNKDILELIRQKKIKYVMSSVTQTNTGATAYFGFLDALAGNPEVLTEEMLNDEKLVNDLISVFSGVERVSGNEDFLKEMFLNTNEYEAVIADEASLININQQLVKSKKEPLYLIYPIDGVAVNDSTFAYIDNKLNKEEIFTKVQQYLLSDYGEEMLKKSGRRTWYGGVNNNVDKNIFNPDWGIDTTKYLNVTKFPSKKVMTKAINLYIEELRKPTHVVFCLDYSGSMNGNGIKELRNAMDYILTYEKASLDKLQFSKKDKITIIPFATRVLNIKQTSSGYDTDALKTYISSTYPTGSTALYNAIINGLEILNKETDDYTKTIIAMTDGQVNVGTYNDLKNYYKSTKSNVPVYSIMFGDASKKQLSQIADLTNAKVFDGKVNLLEAFKEVRSYN